MFKILDIAIIIFLIGMILGVFVVIGIATYNCPIVLVIMIPVGIGVSLGFGVFIWDSIRVLMGKPSFLD